ncbi:twin transmembrane helix small protein [Roseovarius sp. SYSU LYC5161]|jgi:dolichyl-phosphate-mannose--protein O-mannosyl transferase|uniref:twin transmembrane helix small protein n=1 Tax=Roseovarius halophilus (ex Wu et al. 2025) TaxID=3376060 RepID=UPI00287254C5|nr:twin transmembrane helix small protein [Roseovarius sp.]
MMNDPVFLMVAAAMLAVVVILAVGISHFGKGDVESAKKSNRMMKWRLVAQFVAVLLILFFIWFRSGG